MKAASRQNSIDNYKCHVLRKSTFMKSVYGRDSSFDIDSLVGEIDKKMIRIYFKPDEYYEGDTDENFLPDGSGTYYYCNGDVYFGDFVKGFRDGYGEYQYNDDTSYFGEWKNDKKHGNGKFTDKNEGWEFSGQFKNDKPSSGCSSNIVTGANFAQLLENENQEKQQIWDNIALNECCEENDLFFRDMLNKLECGKECDIINYESEKKTYSKKRIKSQQVSFDLSAVTSELKWRCKNCLNGPKGVISECNCGNTLRKARKYSNTQQES